MGVLDILSAQLIEPFRIGLLIALAVTAKNTAGATGAFIPLLLGVVFVAVLIPITLGSGAADKTTAISIGLVSNAIILAAILAIRKIYRRFRRS